MNELLDTCKHQAKIIIENNEHIEYLMKTIGEKDEQIQELMDMLGKKPKTMGEDIYNLCIEAHLESQLDKKDEEITELRNMLTKKEIDLMCKRLKAEKEVRGITQQYEGQFEKRICSCGRLV